MKVKRWMAIGSCGVEESIRGGFPGVEEWIASGGFGTRIEAEAGR